MSASEQRKRIDTLSTGETFAIAGFSFRMENKLSPTGKAKRFANHHSSPRIEPPRNYSTLQELLERVARRKVEESEKSGSDRSENGNCELIQAELL